MSQASNRALEPTLDLDAYLARINYCGPLHPDLETLRGLHFAHTTSIPFENLDVLLGRPISLDLHDIQAKLVSGGRGGYCFEQNALLAAVLDELGFRVTRLAGRVRKGDSAIRPRTHMILLVTLNNERWLVDVGFGSEGLLYPLRLDQETPCTQGVWTYRMQREGDLYVLQTLSDAGWFDLFAFTLETQYPIDYTMANYFTYSHPKSPFTTTLLVQRSTADARWILLNRQLITARAGIRDVKSIPDDSALLTTLSECFNLHFPPGTRFNFLETSIPGHAEQE